MMLDLQVFAKILFAILFLAILQVRVRESLALSIWRQGLLVLPALLFFAGLVANTYVGAFSRYVADDYCFAGILRTKGLIPAQGHWYITWTGRFSFTLLITLAEVIGPKIVPALPFLALATWLAATCWTIVQIKKLSGLGSSWVVPFLLAVTIVSAAVDGAPSVEQSLFWQAGMITYVAPLIVLTLITGLISVALIRRNCSAICLISVAGLSLLAGGFSETYVALQTTFFGLAAAISAMAAPRPIKRTALFVSIAGLIGSALAMAAIIVAPGSAVRQTFFPASPGMVSVLKISGQAAAAFISGSFKDTAITEVLLLLSLLYTIAARSGGIKLPNCSSSLKIVMLVAVTPLVVFVLVWACFAPSQYGMSIPPPARALEIPRFVLLIGVLFEGYLLGRAGKSFQQTKDMGMWAGFLMVATFFFIALLLPEPIFFIQRTLSKVPRMSAFAARWDRQDREIRSAKEAGRSNLQVESVRNEFDLDDIGNDKGWWINACAAQYYGVDSISAE